MSLLEPFHIREGEEPKRPPPVLLHDAEAWDVEKVLTDKMYRKRRYYLVRWVEYPPEEDTWEPECHGPSPIRLCASGFAFENILKSVGS